MHFPVYFHVWKFVLPPHPVMEFLAYTVGFQIYLILKKQFRDVVKPAERWQVIAAAAFGAAIGCRLLGWLENPVAAWHSGLAGGKTIVGALIGGWLAVEWTKRKMGVQVRTGDLFAIPLAVGIAIGRVGCFLTGLADQTHGIATSLPWGVDFGDGVRRHPTQLYEVVFLCLFVIVLWHGMQAVARGRWNTGDVFRTFIAGYMLWRLAVDFLKPEPRIVGLSVLQWACLLVVACCWKDMRRIAGQEGTAHSLPGGQ